MKYITLLIGLCLPLILASQKKSNIPTNLLSQTSHPTDSTASAAYILDQLDAKYNFNPAGVKLHLNYHSIIKIYDKEGEKYGTKEIYLFGNNGKKFEKIKKIKAATTNLENGKPITTILDKKDIYEESYSEEYKKVVFALPNVKAGSVIEIKFTIESPYNYTIPRWYFQNYIPTDKSVMNIKVPNYYTLTPIPKGFVKVESSQKKIKHSPHGEVEYNLTATDLPALIEDDFVLNENDYRSGMKFEIQSVKYPDTETIHFSKTWSDIATQLNESVNFGKQLKKKLNALNPIIDQAKKLESTECIQYLYDYVSQNYSWNETYSRSSIDGLKKVIDNKSGTTGELNLILLYMLRKCNIESYPLVMRSRYSGILNIHYPSLTELNHTTVYIPKEENGLILDASSKFTPLGELPPRSININGLLVKDNNSGEIISISNPNCYETKTLSQYEYDLTNNMLIGSSTRKRMGYAATKFRTENNGQSIDKEKDTEGEEDDQDDYLEDYNLENSYVMKTMENLDDLYSPIDLEYEEKIYDCTKSIGEKIFIDATLDFGLNENPFTEEFRDYPIFYKNSIKIREVVSIKIPENYVLESMPEPINAILENELGSFSYMPRNMGDRILINYYFNIKQPIILPDKYFALKQLYDMMHDLTREKIVLTKA